MKPGRLATFLVCLTLALAANPQLAAPASANENDSPLLPPPLPGTEGVPPADNGPPADNSTTAPGDSWTICQMVESAAAANGLPSEFFAQIIWQESRFRSDTLGPITRNGQRAQGIAQFMPMTAAERLVQNPFDPVEALPKSAEFLRELRAQFGNLGLAAAAYNAGPQRVRNWLSGKRGLPSETQTYVRKVTGRSAQEWAQPDQNFFTVAISKEIPCAHSVKLVARAQSPPSVIQPNPASTWGVQLTGDRSELKALAAYRQLQKKHDEILGNYEPVIIRTVIRLSAAPIWTRVRVDADSREAALTLCSRLRAVGESCVLAHN